MNRGLIEKNFNSMYNYSVMQKKVLSIHVK